MSIVEIVLIIAGVIVFALGYLLPARKRDINLEEEMQMIGEEEVRRLIDRESENVKAHISDIVDETVSYAIEKTERSMERVTNEKMMAVNEYSDTVLEEINKNHKEVLFLYDMLSDRHEDLKNTVSEATRTAEDMKQTVKDAEVSAKEAQKEAEEAVKNVELTMQEAKEAAKQAALEVIANMEPIVVTEPAGTGRAAVMESEPADSDGLTGYGGRTAAFDALAGQDVMSGSDKMTDYDEESAFTEPVLEELTADREPELTGGEPEDTFAETGTEPKEDAFVPITPPRVEIIHDPEGDYVAPPVQQPAQQTKSVNIQFANGRGNGRNSNDRILELHKAGKSNMAIAKELGLGIGEVKLVIDLFEGNMK